MCLTHRERALIRRAVIGSQFDKPIMRQIEKHLKEVQP